MVNLCFSFSLLKKYIRKRWRAFAIVLMSIFVFFAIFVLFSGKANIPEISTEILVYSGLLVIFYAYVM